MEDPTIIVDDQGVEHEFPPGFDPKRAAGIVAVQGAPSGPLPLVGPALVAAPTLAKAARAGIRTLAQRTIESPAAARWVQRAVGAGMGLAGGTVGNTMGGAPGAIVGQQIASKFIPTQAGIRTIAGRLAGEAPAATQSALRSQAAIEYAKSLGTTIKPSDLVDLPSGGTAIPRYTEAIGKKVIQLVDPYGRIVSGPGAAIETAAPKTARMLPLLGQAARVAGGAINFGEVAQMAEPNRRDIGTVGIGQTIHVPGEHPAVVNRFIHWLRSR